MDTRRMLTSLLVLLVVGLGHAAGDYPEPQMELLFEGNITSTGLIAETGWWYTGDYVAGLAGTSAANIDTGTAAIAFDSGHGSPNMQAAFNGGLDSFTITCWIKSDTLLGNNRTIVSNMNTTATQGFYVMAGAAYPGALLLKVNGAYTWGPVEYDVTGDWQFVAMTYDGTQSTNNVVWYWYADGALQSTTRSNAGGSTIATPGEPIVIGGEASSARLNAELEDFRMWAGAAGEGAVGVLTAAQIEEVMNDHGVVPYVLPGAPQLELLLENNMISTGTVQETGWWYAGDYVAGVDGTIGANFDPNSKAIAFGTVAGGSLMQEALNAGLDSFTLTCWVKSDQVLAGDQYIFSNWTGSKGFRLFAGNGYPGALLLGINGSLLWGPGSKPYSVTGDWQFIGLTYDGTQSTDNVVWYYQEGGALISKTMSVNAGPVLATPTKSLIIGGEGGVSTPRLDAVVDDFRIWGSKTGQGNAAVLDPNQMLTVMNTHTTLGPSVTYMCDEDDLGMLAGDWLKNTIVWDNDMTVDPCDAGWVWRNAVPGDYTMSGGKMIISGNTGSWRLDTAPQNPFPGTTTLNASLRATTTSGTGVGAMSGIGMWLNVDTRNGGDYGAINFYVVLEGDNTQYVEFISDFTPGVNWPPASYLRVQGDGVTDFDNSMLDIELVVTPGATTVQVDYTITDQAGTTVTDSFTMNRRTGSAVGFEAATILSGGAQGEVDDVYISAGYISPFDITGDDIVNLYDFAWLADRWKVELDQPCWTLP